MTTATKDNRSIPERIAGLDWEALAATLDERGFAVTAPVLDAGECEQLAELFDSGHFRSTIDMAPRDYGAGRYRYFDHPLPEAVAELRGSFYRALAPVANLWAERLGNAGFPAEHEQLIERCREAGQLRPTPLILRYGPGDWNALHQDLYGEVYFPFQVLTVLSPARAYRGGELVFVEQRPRAQSRAHALRPPQGAFVIFPTRERPASSRRGGHHRVAMRHGVSTISSGSRTTLGIIFHDAS